MLVHNISGQIFPLVAFCLFYFLAEKQGLLPLRAVIKEGACLSSVNISVKKTQRQYLHILLIKLPNVVQELNDRYRHKLHL